MHRSRASIYANVGILGILAALHGSAIADVPVFILAWGDGVFAQPRSLDTGSDGRVYVLDNVRNSVEVFTSRGVFLTRWGASGSGLTVGTEDNVYVAGGVHVSQFTKDGVFVRQWGSLGTGDGQFSRITDIASDDAGNLYVPDADQLRVQKFASDGTYLGQWSLVVPSSYWVFYLTVDGSGRVLVCGCQVYSQAPGVVCRYSPAGDLLDTWGGFDWTINGIGSVPGGGFYAALGGFPWVQRFSAEGGLLEDWRIYDGHFRGACDVVATSAGEIYVADCGGEIELFQDVSVPTRLTTWGRVKTLYR